MWVYKILCTDLATKIFSDAKPMHHIKFLKMHNRNRLITKEIVFKKQDVEQIGTLSYDYFIKLFYNFIQNPYLNVCSACFKKVTRLQ